MSKPRNTVTAVLLATFSVTCLLGSLGGCADSTVGRDVGAVAGAVGGGVLGSQFGSGTGKLAATILGAGIGGILGANIGKRFDDNDRKKVGQALENNRDGETLPWRNEDTGASYETTPNRTWQAGSGEYCREFTQTSEIAGRRENVTGTACRQADGNWKIVSEK